ncbi:MAG: hypothetical protein O3B87_04455 [bacterium]|nr:hypothetical protein [bacterium]
MTKTIVTHMSPDLDAIASAWLVKRYLPGWESAEHEYVPAGESLNGMKPDSDPEIVHVDTGLGKFDHHQFSERLSATKRVFDHLAEEGYIKERDIEALEQMTHFINEIDNFGEVAFPEPVDIRYAFCLHEFIYPLRGKLSSDTELMNAVMLILDSILVNVKNNINAAVEVKEGAVIVNRWGKTLFMETKNEVSVKYALKVGYDVVVRRDPETSTVRIKTQPKDGYDLTPLYDIVKKRDPKATWFLHASTHMLLNGSSKNPNSIPSSLTLAQLIAILKDI